MAQRKPKKAWHRHGCRGCNEAFVDACDTPELNNEKCTFCLGGQGFALIRENAWPKDCCLAHATRLASKGTDAGKYLDTYRLSRGITWYQCELCKRAFPYAMPKPKTPTR